MREIRSQTLLGWVLVLLLAACGAHRGVRDGIPAYTTTLDATFYRGSENKGPWVCDRVPKVDDAIQCDELEPLRRARNPAPPKPLEL